MTSSNDNTKMVAESSSSTNQFNNMTTISNVADIFHAAGYAFKKLSELIQSMDPVAAESSNNNNSGNNIENGYQSHWDQADVEHFNTIVHNFVEDLNQLSMNLKNKMANRLKEEHMDAKVKTLNQQEQDLIITKEELN